MSDSSPLRKLPQAVLQGTALLRVTNPSDMPSEVVQRETLSPDIQAFCSLVARILLRCLRERDEKTLKTLSLWREEEQPGEKHVSTEYPE
jgi:hypothetical protein